ncbi:MAG: hypothetical protein LBO20_05360, partial [Bifidobacteriaceae bacterium]|nr:hypothetical protein [Bifidobacteriaceae bacterium]
MRLPTPLPAAPLTAYQPSHDLFSSMPFGLALAGTGLAALAVAVFWLRKKRQVRGRRRWRVAAYVTGGLSLVVGLACAVNAYVGWAPNIEAALIRAGLSEDVRPDTQLARGAPEIGQLGDHPVTRPDTPIATTADVPNELDPARRSEDRGAVGRFTLPAPTDLNLPSAEILIYTPPGYDPSGDIAYPVLYLAHGS